MAKRNYHGYSKTRLYRIYHKMRQRCNNKNNDCYHHYGGRGIKLCDEWENNFLSFREWAFGNGYKDKLTIDRINVNGNYEPNNCRWIQQSKQLSNTRRNVKITIDNQTKIAKDWENCSPVSYPTITQRIRRGESKKDAVKKIPYQNHMKKIMCVETGKIFNSMSECAKYFGVSRGMITMYFKDRYNSIKGYQLKKIKSC